MVQNSKKSQKCSRMLLSILLISACFVITNHRVAAASGQTANFHLVNSVLTFLLDGPQIPVVPPPPLLTDMKTFIFGHSLIVHDPPLIPVPSDETAVPHWMRLLAITAGYDYAADGQYGFLPQHAQLPPSPQWGFDSVPGVWQEPASFADSDFTTVLITAANFIQYQPATEPYDGVNPDNITPLGATLDIIDWVNQQEPGIDVYIYENWPDMGYLPFPPSSEQFAEYNAIVLNTFHQWWVDYMAEIVAARPALNVRMIPVGPVISHLLTTTDLGQIPITELYEDNAPHGRATIYFLAALVTYMTTYGVKAPDGFQVPVLVHERIRNNYQRVVDDIWLELQQRGAVPAGAD